MNFYISGIQSGQFNVAKSISLSVQKLKIANPIITFQWIPIRYDKYSVCKCGPNSRIANCKDRIIITNLKCKQCSQLFHPNFFNSISIPFAILIRFVTENENCSGNSILLLFFVSFRTQTSYCKIANNNNNNNNYSE